jgi:hypothetical protein
VRWRWCSFPPATFAVCQSARQSRAAARVLAAARTTGTLTLSSPRAPAESSRLHFLDAKIREAVFSLVFFR